MKFRDAQHSSDYAVVLKRMKRSNCYHLAVAYLLTLDTVCVKHINDLFDFEEDCIKLDVLNYAWQTGTSQKTTRLIFNLWNGCTDDYDENGIGTTSPYFAVDEIFCCEYASYFFEAIKLRYPEYISE